MNTKYLITALIMNITISMNCFAEIVSINTQEKTVYMHTKPHVEMTLQNLDDGTGMLYVFSEYNNENLTKEIDDIKHRFPGYKVVSVMAETPNQEASLKIGDILSVQLPVRLSQSGPYLNSYVGLTKTQLKLLELITLETATKITIPGKTTLRQSVVKEHFTASPEICREIKTESLKELIVSLQGLSRPPGIQLDSTFEDLKVNILNQCFEIEPVKISTFKELLGQKVSLAPASRENGATRIEGVTLEKVSVPMTFNLSPTIKAEKI